MSSIIQYIKFQHFSIFFKRISVISLLIITLNIHSVVFEGLTAKANQYSITEHSHLENLWLFLLFFLNVIAHENYRRK